MDTKISSMPRKAKPFETATVRVPKPLASQLRMLAGAAGKDISDYLNEILRPIVAKEVQRLARSLISEEK